MGFRTWIEEQEASMGSGSPEMMPQPPMINKGSDTPASDEVKRTGLQPQVDQPNNKSSKEQDALLAIDSEIEHMDTNLPDEEEGTPKVNNFKKLWDELKQKWEKVKMDSPDEPAQDEDGLGHAKDDKFTKKMQQFPNMMPASPESQSQGGPGVFGLS